MKVLIIRNFPNYTPIRNSTYNIQELGLARALVRRGHTCDIMMWTPKSNEEEDVWVQVKGAKSICVMFRHGITVLKNTIYTGCNKIFKMYDVIQPCEYNQMQSWILAKRYPKKTIIYHGPYYCTFNKRYNMMCSLFDMFFLKRYIRLGTRFIVKSDMAKQFLEDKCILPDFITTVGVGIDIESLTNTENSICNKIFSEINKSGNEIKLLYIGKIERRRNVKFIFEVLKEIINKVEAKLYLVGSGDANYIQECFDYAKQLGVYQHIIWENKMEQKYLGALYKEADFFLLPTEYEIFGMVLLEAMYFGDVVLTTKNGGSAMLIQSGKNGFVFDKLDVECWANTIYKTYYNKQLLNDIKLLASNTIENHFKWDDLVERILCEYRKVGK